MIIDLISSNNYVNFNLKLAHIIGLKQSIYISELLNINDKAIRKNKVEDNYFSIDRNYIKQRTTLCPEEQLEIEKDLMTFGILEPYGKDDTSICLNITALTSILTNPDETFIKDIKKIVKQRTQPKKTKAEKIIEALKDNVECTNDELREAYFEWIDAVYAKQGWMSKKSITNGQKSIDTFTNRNLDMALKILDIATINGYRDIEWAINKYKSDYNIIYSNINFQESDITNRNVQLAEEVF
jgi:hypothetical protein